MSLPKHPIFQAFFMTASHTLSAHTIPRLLRLHALNGPDVALGFTQSGRTGWPVWVNIGRP